MKRLLNPIALCALFLFACNQAEEPKTEVASVAGFDLAAAKDSINATNSRFAAAVVAGDSVTLAAFYASDAKILPPNSPAISGNAAITSLASSFCTMGIKDMKFDVLGVWGNKDVLCEEGTVTMTDDKGALIDKGKYIVLWKQEDGKWKLFRDIFNSDMPPAPAQPSDRRR